MKTQPVFLFSLPRSGSTLLQRMLSATDECASFGEPSFLLRFLGEDGIMDRKSPYGDYLVKRSRKEVTQAFPQFEATYREGVRLLAESLYQECAGEARYFIDKTPRYSLIAAEIVECFPDAKFIFLWRNPGAIAASMANTWRKGKWDLASYRVDFGEGFRNLQKSASLAGERGLSLNYEDLVGNREESSRQLEAFLGLEGLQEAISKGLPAPEKGVLGDPTGGQKYSEVSSASVDEWRQHCRNWFRYRTLSHLVALGGEEHWEKIGYPPSDWQFEAGSGKAWQGVHEWLHSWGEELRMWAPSGLFRNLRAHSHGLRSHLSYR